MVPSIWAPPQARVKRSAHARPWRVLSTWHRGAWRAAVGHALDFPTWRSLVRDHGLSDDQATALMVALVRCSSIGETSRGAPRETPGAASTERPS